MFNITLFLLVSFLLGSVPFGHLLVKIVRKKDVREFGSGNIGATNVARAAGKGIGCLTLALDVFKGFLPVGIAVYLGNLVTGVSIDNGRILASFVAMAAVLGHMYTPWLGFKGGKGVATALGAALIFYPAAVLPALGIFLITVAITRYVSLGSILGALSLPLFFVYRLIMFPRSDMPYILVIWSAIALLVVFKHHENIKRLLKGEENKLTMKK
jgi:glycerol-3-phosphate acyltransferase PlsY